MGEGKKEKEGWSRLFQIGKRGTKLLIKKFREDQQFKVHFKSDPLPKVGVMQSNHLMIVCDMNFDNY